MSTGKIITDVLNPDAFDFRVMQSNWTVIGVK
jgi:hypothetical protein